MRPGLHDDGKLWVGIRGKITVFDPILVLQVGFGLDDGIGGRPYVLSFEGRFPRGAFACHEAFTADGRAELARDCVRRASSGRQEENRPTQSGAERNRV